MFSKEQIGYIYCIHNKMYTSYGENVYKLTHTKNTTECKIIDSLLDSLTNSLTHYIEPSVVIYSVQVKNYEKAEELLFKILNEYRIVPNRDFFQYDKNNIIKSMDFVANFLKTASENDIIKNLQTYLDCKDIQNSNNITEFEYKNLCNELFLTYNQKCSVEKYKYIKIFKSTINQNNLTTLKMLENYYSIKSNHQHSFFFPKTNKYIWYVKQIINLLGFDQNNSLDYIDNDAYDKNIQNHKLELIHLINKFHSANTFSEDTMYDILFDHGFVVLFNNNKYCLSPHHKILDFI